MKPFWKSKTLWFNACIAIFTFVGINLSDFKEGMSPEGYQVLAMVVTIGNMILRSFTNTAVGVKNEK